MDTKIGTGTDIFKIPITNTIVDTLNTTVQSYTDFTSVPDNTNINGYTSLIGAAYTNPASDAIVQSGYLVPTTTAFYYARQDHSSIVDRAVITFSLSGTVTATLPAITIAMGAQTSLAVGVLHLQTTPSTATLMVRQTGTDTNEIVGQFNYTNTLQSNGDLYRIEMSTYGNRVVILGPNGENWSVTDNRFLAVRGNSSFFEAQIESNASFVKVKRFYTTTSNTTNVPSPYKTPTEIDALTNFSHNGVGNPSVFGGTPSEISFYVGPQGYPQMGFGPASFFSATVLASISIGASTFSVNAYLPAGVYTIDVTSSNGANREQITITTMAGATSPFTATISGTFAKAHTASTRAIPVTVISTFQPAPMEMGIDQFGLLNTPSNTSVNGNLRLRNGGDYYSTVFANISTNYARLFDIGPANPSSLGVTGGFRVVEGTNCYAGVATLVAGTVTVSTTRIATGDRVTLHRQASGGTLGHLSVGTITNGASFVINSSSGTDTSVIFWEIRRPG